MIHNDLLSKYFIFWQKTQQRTELIIKHCVDTTENKEREEKKEIGKIILLY